MTAPVAAPAAVPAYVEFAIQSNFSFLRGASKPEELVLTAHLLGYAGIGMADRNTVAGVVRAWTQSKHILHETNPPASIPYHPGCRLAFSDGTPDILAYPRDRQGWAHLCRLLTEANEKGDKGDPDVTLDMLLEWGDRMSLVVMPDARPAAERLALLKRLKERFGRAVRVGTAVAYDGNDRFALEENAALAQAAGLPLMAVGNVLYHMPVRRELADVLTAIRLRITVEDAGYELARNAERYMKPPAELARLFQSYPQALAETVRFAGELTFSLDQLRYFYPKETAEGASAQAELVRLTWEGAARRYPNGIPDKIVANIETELKLIGEKEYADYFLTVHDIVSFARSEDQKILCQGRGSAANSTVCYCMGITEVDPQLSDLLFERFLSPDRNEPPDIDIDFEHERRDPVMRYIYEKYSGRRTALTAAVISYRSRSAIREVSKAMGLSEDVTNALSSIVKGWWTEKITEREVTDAGLDPGNPTIRKVVELANAIRGFPRHLSQHVGGFVITQDRLDEVVPIVKTTMPDRMMVEWDKDDLDAVGILKVDILALGMLSCLRRCFDLLQDRYPHHWPARLELATIPHRDDNEVYAMIQRADTIGVFQIESRAQMSMLPRLKPRCFYDLVIEVAIVRPGPIQGDMVHPYLRRRDGLEAPEYQKPELKAILSKTLGVPLFQEQAMKIAMVAGGFSGSEADQLRRAMATFKRTGQVKDYHTRMVEGMVAKGYDRAFAERCFSQIEGFGEYGFPESHAASFALLVYASAWFKTYYPDIFCAALLNSQPMGFYSPGQLVRDAREHGVAIREVDVNHSEWDCTLEPDAFEPGRIAPKHESMRGVIRTGHAVRLGLRQIKGLSAGDAEALAENRGQGYASVRDLWLRSGLPRAVIQKLAEADAFRSIGLDRRAALWQVKALDEKSAAERLPLFERPGLDLRELEPETRLPAMPNSEHVVQDYRALTFSLKAHPLSFLRREFDGRRAVANERLTGLASGRKVSVAGLVLIRQRPGTAKGVIFMTIEDETGVANIIVWRRVFERFRPVVLGARLIQVTGRLQSASGVIHVVAERIEDMSHLLRQLSEGAEKIDYRSPTDETKRPVERDHRTRRKLSDAQRRTLDEMRRKRIAGPEPVEVMPKGRNFH